ncbi:MAG: FeoB-associated Cys-rich membrane protein [Syntrophomonadaceae bacterium]|nr:FeoB-associated Cys-rich membrane protein [Syntrophomonadaceae bacterium]MDD3889406.1 FeoB-associated Cys-rich membrane protein [Syntrophomonadaceae bacterium]MDD4549520.1 FeoB-associated Cys-rich membrane protein [Syntrophomonadaceae bacterium]
MEKLVVGIILTLAVIFLFNRIRKLVKDPNYKPCSGNCSQCETYKELQIGEKTIAKEKED